MPTYTINLLPHRTPLMAQSLHSLLVRAHAQEAGWLQSAASLPLEVTPASIQASPDHYLGAVADDALAGAISVGLDDEPGQILIKLLVVYPDHQRRGVARALLQEALSRGNGAAFAVVTAAGNAPALALYQSLGFEVYREGSLGPQALPMVKLRRAGVARQP
jgi:ribosomal protein S18 acetylase RimI-like enzyme